ncbi:MAG TPA: hypothetical protein DD738_03885 [Ruminiclostridium sp.]|jgi:hypothetical protein|nr:hypothetical protein [Ruminiclostridium sp.]
MTDAYEKLANAIVLQAVKDYRFALKRLAKHPHNESALYTKREVERFFRSGFFSDITSIDHEMLIQKLQEEVVR